jgi:hypothetical protein
VGGRCLYEVVHVVTYQGNKLLRLKPWDLFFLLIKVGIFVYMWKQNWWLFCKLNNLNEDFIHYLGDFSATLAQISFIIWVTFLQPWWRFCLLFRGLLGTRIFMFFVIEIKLWF